MTAPAGPPAAPTAPARQQHQQDSLDTLLPCCPPPDTGTSPLLLTAECRAPASPNSCPLCHLAILVHVSSCWVDRGDALLLLLLRVGGHAD